MKRIWALGVALLAAAPAWAADPPVAMVVGPRHGHCTPDRAGCTHTAGGNIIVTQPTPDVLVVTMTGVAVATGHPFSDSHAAMNFDLNQELKVVFNDSKVKKAKLEMEAVVIGLLRADASGFGQTGGNAKHGHHGNCGTAQQGAACAAIASGPNPITSLCVDPHGVSCGEYLSMNCHNGPCSVPIAEGCYTLHQTFGILAAHPRNILPCKPASAEFAPDALDPLWISYWEPFRGAAKKDFGFQVTIRVSPAD
jgi:hypothetical protein